MFENRMTLFVDLINSPKSFVGDYNKIKKYLSRSDVITPLELTCNIILSSYTFK